MTKKVKSKNLKILKQKHFKNYLMCLFFLLLIQYDSKLSLAKELKENVCSEELIYFDSILDKKTAFQNTANQSTQKNKQKKTAVDTTFALNIRSRYVANVQTCLYIRTSPNISGSNIIQCLIPVRMEGNVSGMYHELRPTGITDGNWAEFYYSFDIYTYKPDNSPDETFYREWKMKRDKAHESAKNKYKATRKKGWVKFRNEDGTLNIVVPRDRC